MRTRSVRPPYATTSTAPTRSAPCRTVPFASVTRSVVPTTSIVGVPEVWDTAGLAAAALATSPARSLLRQFDTDDPKRMLFHRAGRSVHTGPAAVGAPAVPSRSVTGDAVIGT